MANYSSITNTDAQKICNKYGFNLRTLTPMKGGAANSSFILNNMYILTILDNHNLESANVLTLIMEHLSQNNIPSQKIMKTTNDKRNIKYKEKIVIIREMIVGNTFEQLSEKNYRNVGKLLAKIHLCPCPNFDFQCDRKIPKNWNDMFSNNINCDYTKLQKNLLYSISKESNIFESNLPSGFIHGDLFADNIIQDKNGALFAIDWETASKGPFVYDIGISLVAMAKNDNNQLDLKVLNKILEGYEEIRTLTKEERNILYKATGYAASMLSFHRYSRHVVRYPNPEKFNFYEEQMEFSNNMYNL